MSNCPNYTTVPQKRQLHSLREKNIIIKRFEYRWVFDRKVLFLLFKRGKDFFFQDREDKKKKKKRRFVEAWRGPRYPDRFCKSTEIPRNWVVALEGRRTRHLTANYRLQGERSRFSGYTCTYIADVEEEGETPLGERGIGIVPTIPPEHLRTHLAPIKRPANLFNGAALGDLR